MEMNENQKKAAYFTLKADCLVAAGAGAGKTNVLSARAQYLCEHCRDEEGKRIKPTNLLVLTFTEKAASEMKERIKGAIAASSDHEVAAMAAEVENASICTFDSFAYSIVREYAGELGLSCSPQIGDEAYFAYIHKKLFDDIVERRSRDALDGLDEPFKQFASLYSRSGFDKLEACVDAIEKLASLSGDKASFYRGYRDAYWSERKIEQIKQEACAKIKFYIDQAYRLCSQYEDADLASFDLEVLREFYNLSLDELPGKKLALKTKPRGKGTPDDAVCREWVRDLLKKATNLAECLTPEKLEMALPCLKQSEIPLQIANEINERLSKFKFENGIFNFDDIAELATKACHNPKIIAALKKKYRYIMVDEFQDTTNLQMNLLSELRDHNFFAVGDVKQSIYGFRNANPDLFVGMMNACDDKECHLVRLSQNYRSRNAVLENVNRLFESCMTPNFGGVDYQAGEGLLYGLKGYGEDGKNEHGFAKIVFSPEKGETDLESAGRAIAKDIAYLMSRKDKPKVYVKGKEKGRDINYGDFAILAPKNQWLLDLVRIFNEAGIPYIPNVDEVGVDIAAFNDFRSLVKLVNCLLQGDEESFDFKVALASVERSFLFPRFQDDEILKNLNDDYTGLASYKKMKAVLEEAEDLSIKGILEKIRQEFSLLPNLAYLPKQRANLQAFLKLEDFAATFDYIGEGFAAFADFVAKIDPSSLKLKVENGLDGNGAVKGLTIHRSKGLEYPYVYLLGNEKDLGKSQGSQSFVANLEYGLVLPYPGTGEKSILDMMGRESERESLRSERLRLFYVAITRARERCTFLLRDGKKKEGDEQKADPAKPPYLCKNQADLLRQAPDLKYIHIDYSGMGALPALDHKSVEVKIKEIPEFDLKEKAKSAYSDHSVHSDEQAIAYGERIHRLLELTDFKRRLIPDACNETERRKIAALLDNPLFEGIEREYHEYRFQGEDGEGCIDLFFIKNGRLCVIDFKSSDLDNPQYIDQVKGYCDYLSKAFGLPCEGYLLSYARNELRKVA